MFVAKIRHSGNFGGEFHIHLGDIQNYVTL